MKTLSSILLFAALLQLAVMVASEKVFTAKPMSSKLLKNTYQLKRLEHSQLTMHSRRVAALGDTISLGGNFQTMGLFYATIELGTPAQPLDVQLDSGSSDLLVFGKTCANCQGNETFNTQATSTLHVVPCEASGYTCHDCAQFNGENACSFSDYYGDGSGVNGSVVTDYLTVGSYNNVNVSFGYISSSTPGFENPPVDGIWGISYPDLAITTPAIQTLIQQYGLYNGFSMCLSLDSPTFSIGAPSTPASAFKFTPITQEEYYNVQITDVEVEGNSLGMSNISQAMSIVDSGTTLMLLPQYIMDGMYSSFLSMCSSTHLEGVCGLSQSQSIFNGQTCFTMSQAQQNAYPTVSIKLEGIHQALNVPSSAYLFPEGNQFCMGIQSTGSQNMAILGDVFMTNFNVFFDLSKSRIGFAVPQTCPSSSMAKETVTFN